MTAPIGPELRAIRQRLGWSLQAVQDNSERRFKAVVVGSWERGDRHPPVEALRDLLAFYGGWRLLIVGPGEFVHRCAEQQPVPAGVEGWAIEGRTHK